MAGPAPEMQQPGQAPGAVVSPAGAERTVSPEDKKLAADWIKRIEAALKRVDATFKQFAANRKLLAGNGTDGQAMRANLHYANMAQLLPQVYAKDPEFAAQPSRAVSANQAAAAKRFAATAEFMLQRVVVKDGGLKKQAKKMIRSTTPTAVGWLKASYQEKKGTDPLITNRIKDTQDNIDRLQQQLAAVEDPQAGSDQQLQMAKLRETLAGLESQPEVTVAKGIALDFVLSEDVIVIDPSVRAVTDYTRAAAIGHRVWMTPDKYKEFFGYDAKKAKTYSEQAGELKAGNGASGDKAAGTLLCVWEIWDQESNRVLYVCDGEEGFCKPSSTPDWTGKRWYPFFLLAFNEIDGSFYPLSDIDLTKKLVEEYNDTREDFARDRKGALPLNVVRKGGSLTPSDVERITNRKGSDVVVVDGTPGTPLSNDLWSGQLAKLDPASYDTAGSRYDMERILGGSDATTGSITKAKTATEAEILSQGLRSRAGERQDVIEDLLNELGPYCLEVMLRKFSEAEVQKLAGETATWPQMQVEDIFNLVSVEVRGGSTGKPDRLQEQDRWTKLLPIINEAVAKVSELRQQGQEALAQAVIELTRETLRRFDERLDIEEFLPPMPKDQNDPMALKQQNVQLQQQVQQLQGQLKDAIEKVEKGYVSAAAQIATSNNPQVAVIAFKAVLGEVDPDAVPPTPQPAATGAPGEPALDTPPAGAVPPDALEQPGPEPIPQPQAA